MYFDYGNKKYILTYKHYVGIVIKMSSNNLNAKLSILSDLGAKKDRINIFTKKIKKSIVR